MAIELKMPALSPTMEEGKLAKWLVKEGDEVQAGDILAEIETDKATMEFEAVDEGKVGRIVVPEGAENVKVGTVIALIDGEGETSRASAQAEASSDNSQSSSMPPEAPASAGDQPPSRLILRRNSPMVRSSVEKWEASRSLAISAMSRAVRLTCDPRRCSSRDSADWQPRR